MKKSLSKARSLQQGPYAPWTKSDDQKLLEMHKGGRATSEIAHVLLRTDGAVQSRCRKIGIKIPVRAKELPKPITAPLFHDINHVSIQFTWIPVLKGNGTPYFFPQPIPSVLLRKVRKAVYRWKAVSPDGRVVQYIGQSKDVFSFRIKSYLNPFDNESSTDFRIHHELFALMKQGYVISLELLSYVVALPDGAAIDEDNFRQVTREFLEYVLISGHRNINNSLLN